MSEPTTEDDGARKSVVGRSHRDFSTVCAGYIAGQGVLRLFAGILAGLGDNARAELLLRWLPVLNALGFFILAWAVYRMLIWLGEAQFASPFAARTNVHSESAKQSPSAETGMPAGFAAARSIDGSIALQTSSPSKEAATPTDWKSTLKAAQKRKDVDAILELQRELAKTLAPERAEVVDRRLGKWYTKHFQRMMLSGRAAESAPQVELVAEYYSDSDEFAYFREILPVVRQCAELKESLKDDEE